MQRAGPHNTQVPRYLLLDVAREVTREVPVRVVHKVHNRGRVRFRSERHRDGVRRQQAVLGRHLQRTHARPRTQSRCIELMPRSDSTATRGPRTLTLPG